MGTVGYMSPEQVRGLPVDHRSDIFSFGAILYELLSGKRAFKGDTPADTMSAILKEEPVELLESGRSISPALDHIVKHGLEKDRDNRFQTTKDILFALSEASTSVSTSGAQRVTRVPGRRRVLVAAVVIAALAVAVGYLLRRGREMRAPAATTTAQGRKPSRIVVLPFENLGAPQDAYFAAGMTEEISSRLANLQGLAVISRTTATGYDRKGKTTKQIGADLGVDFVLEGTVLSDRSTAGGGRMRITPQLIQVSDDTQVWGDRYDRVMSDIFTVQSEVAENVVKAMGVKLVPREKTALKTASTNDMEAYDLYLRGLEITRRGETRENLEGGIRMYQAAVDRDPRFPQALAQLARNHLYIRFIFADRSPEHLDKAKDAVDRLAAIGPDLAETHIARGDYAYWGVGDYTRALDEFKAALVLQPSSTDTLEVTGYVLRRQGRWEEAADQLLKWVEIDPRNPLALYQYGLTCVILRRYPEADRYLSLSTSLSPQPGSPWALRGWLQIEWRGDVEKAHAVISEARMVAGLQDSTAPVGINSFRIALIRKDFQGALEQLDGEKRNAFSNQSNFFPIDLLRGEAQSLLGEHDLARRSFEAARRTLEKLVSENPDEERYQSSLGIACAALGLREEALKAAKRGTELMPPSKDAMKANLRIEHLALVQTMVGQQNEAIDGLDFLLSRPSLMSAQVLRLDPRWEPLRSNPRFQALLAKYSDKP